MERTDARCCCCSPQSPAQVASSLPRSSCFRLKTTFNILLFSEHTVTQNHDTQHAPEELVVLLAELVQQRVGQQAGQQQEPVPLEPHQLLSTQTWHLLNPLCGKKFQ